MADFITFNAHDIQLEGVEADVELPATWLDQVLRETEVKAQRDVDGAGRLTGRLSRSGHDIVVRGRVVACLELPCARCLEPVPLVVHAELALLLQPRSRSEPRGRRQDQDAEYEFTANEADLDTYDGETVVLDDFVREAILLEVPTFPLCRDNCPGIPSAVVVEAKPRPDPRLAPLDAFRNRTDGATTITDLVLAAAERSASLGRKPILRSNHSGRRKRRGKK